MRISDWSSDVCSSDLLRPADIARRIPTLQSGSRDARTWIEPVFCPGASVLLRARARQLWKSEILYASMLPQPAAMGNHTDGHKIGRASGRERVCQDG